MAEQKVKVKVKSDTKGIKIKNTGTTNDNTHVSSSGGTHGGSGAKI